MYVCGVCVEHACMCNVLLQAQQYDYSVEIREPKTPWRFKTRELERSVNIQAGEWNSILIHTYIIRSMRTYVTHAHSVNAHMQAHVRTYVGFKYSSDTFNFGYHSMECI